MASSLFNKVVQFANSPKGKQDVRQATEKAQQLAKDPKTRAKIDDVRRSGEQYGENARRENRPLAGSVLVVHGCSPPPVIGPDGCVRRALLAGC